MTRLLTLVFLIASGPLAADERIAFFGLTMLDDSLQTAQDGGNAVELARLEKLEAMIADRFREEGYTLVDMAPVQEDLDRVLNPAKCNGCEVRMAGKLDADFALVGEVQKTSNLILAMNLQLRDVQSGETVKGRVVDIRGNTDESWTRGMRYILKTAFFPPEQK